MLVNLIKKEYITSLLLPDKVDGKFWLKDYDKNGIEREIIGFEAVGEEWIIKNNNKIIIYDDNGNEVQNRNIKDKKLLRVKIIDDENDSILFMENTDSSRYIYKRIIAIRQCVLHIGRGGNNEINYNESHVSYEHAKLMYDGNRWSVEDLNSTNGTYVNGKRVNKKTLQPCDVVYIMGLKIVIGSNFLAINDPDNMVKINTKDFLEFKYQKIENGCEIENRERKFFYRSPRFYRGIEPFELKIDSPPQLQRADTVPMIFMLGPSITMGMTSISTAIISVNNVISNGGKISQALPMLIMAVGMLLGTVMWPILTKKNEKKNKIKQEKVRQEKYLLYLDNVRDEIKRKIKEQSEILRENLISPEECCDRIINIDSKLWERDCGQKDFLNLRLGIGELPLNADISYQKKSFSIEEDDLFNALYAIGSEQKKLVDVPIGLSLVNNASIGIFGKKNDIDTLISSLILQIITLHSYDEVKIMLMCDVSDEKQWIPLKFIPHFWDDSKQMRFFGTSEDDIRELASYIDKKIINVEDNQNNSEDKDIFYIIISLSKILSDRCEALEQLSKCKKKNFCVINTSKNVKELPKDTKVIINVNGNSSEVFSRENSEDNKVVFSLDELNREKYYESISKIADVELDLGVNNYSLPSMITFLEMFNVGKNEHLNAFNRWKENNPTISLRTPVGVNVYGERFNLDLHEKVHGPHGLVAGMTGSGKSEFIITYILSLAVNYHPNEVAFILIDYKGGGLAGAFEDSERGIKLPHLAGVITNLDGAAVKRSLISIQSELRYRQAVFNEAKKISNEGTMDIYKYQQLYREKIVTEPIPHLFIISDEFAELKTQQPEFMEQLISAARIGRSLGVHLILATQKPSGVVDDQIWSNSRFRVCLKVQEKSDSQDMIKRPDAAELSQTGRFYLQVGFNEFFSMGQSAWCGADYIPTDVVEKKTDLSVKLINNTGRSVITVKPSSKATSTEKRTKQIVSIVKYLSDLAIEENISVRKLWLDAIPEKIYIDELGKKYASISKGTTLNPIVGEYDDPFNQRQNIVTVPFSKEGNCLIYGATGGGKAMFLASMCYSLIKNHTAREVNIYILDFGSETLKVFENAPQVGDVVRAGDDEKIRNLIKMLLIELDNRKDLFSDYGGDFTSYCKNSGKIIPNIVVIVNNYSAFSDEYEDVQESFTMLTKEGFKYGIYFAVSAINTGDVRYRTQQNFKMMFTMQLNDAGDYPIIVGKTDGLIPSKYKGRGLLLLDRVYEFQTAYCSNSENEQDFLREYCNLLCDDATDFAKQVPILPEIVSFEHVKDAISTLSSVPIGVNKNSLDIVQVNINNKVVLPILSHDIMDTVDFVNGFVNIIKNLSKTIIVDLNNIFDESSNIIKISNDYESAVVNMFNEMVERNNKYKDSGLNIESLNTYEDIVYVLFGFNRLLEQLSEDGKDKLKVLLDKGQNTYKIHFIVIDSPVDFGKYANESWYRKNVTGSYGIWVGEGINNQYVLKYNSRIDEKNNEISSEYGFIIEKNKPVLVKLLSCMEKEEMV